MSIRDADSTQNNVHHYSIWLSSFAKHTVIHILLVLVTFSVSLSTYQYHYLMIL